MAEYDVGAGRNVPVLSPQELLACAREALRIEQQAIEAFAGRIGEGFIAAVELIRRCAPPGKVAVLGMGKSGHIGHKIAATLASIGTPAFFVHPAEAGHGDLGMIGPGDVAIAISYSGSSDEVLRVLPYFKRYGIPVIAFTQAASPLAEHSDVVIDIAVEREACPLGLAPTASTVVTLAAGDALAMCLLKQTGFQPDDFAERHPHGALGRRLLVQVGDLMLKGEDIPRIGPEASLVEALLEMSRGTIGTVAITDAGGRVQGIFTDGDLRRTLLRGSHVFEHRIREFMTLHPKTIQSSRLAVEAVEAMDTGKVNGLLVTLDDGRLEGVITMRMLIHANVV